MTVRQVESRITNQLAEGLVSLGFKKQNQFLIARKKDKRSEQVRCGVRKHGVSKALFVSLMIGVRFEEIEVLLEHTGDPNTPTISVPIHFLHEGRQFVEWNAESPGIATLLHIQVEMYALPFFERFDSLQSLKSQLNREADYRKSASAQMARLNSEQERKELRLEMMHDQRLLLPLSPDQRVEILAAIDVINGDVAAARSLVDGKKSELENAKPIPPIIVRRTRLERVLFPKNDR
jgi:hypothetical protein